MPDIQKIKSKGQQILSLALVGGLIYLAVLWLWPTVFHFNPQYLVENSSLKNKTFSGTVKEIVTPKLKLKAYLYEEQTNPIVSVSFLFKESGTAYEPQNLIGSATLLASMLKKGAGPYSMTNFNEQLEENAIHLGFSADKDNFYGVLLFIKDDMEKAVKLTNLALTSPKLEEKYLSLSKNDARQKYKFMQEDPNTYLNIIANEKLFSDHPYRRSLYSEINNILRRTPDDLRKYAEQYLTRDKLIVSVSGDISEDEAAKLVDSLFVSVPATSSPSNLKRAKIDIASPDDHIQRKINQSIGLFYGQGVARQDERFYPLVLAMEVLCGGGGLNSRIQKAARANQGLTYGVYGSLANLDKADFLHGRFSTTPENFYTLKQIVREEWEKLGAHGVSAEELQQVKDYMIASEPLRYADIDNISATMTGMQKMNLGLDFLQKRNTYIDNVNLEDVNRVAKEYFTPQNLRFISIGDSDKMGVEKKNENSVD